MSLRVLESLLICWVISPNPLEMMVCFSWNFLVSEVYFSSIMEHEVWNHLRKSLSSCLSERRSLNL